MRTQESADKTANIDFGVFYYPALIGSGLMRMEPLSRIHFPATKDHPGVLK